MSFRRMFRRGRKNVSRCPEIPTFPGCPGSAVPEIWPTARRRVFALVPSMTMAETTPVEIRHVAVDLLRGEVRLPIADLGDRAVQLLRLEKLLRGPAMSALPGGSL